MIAATAAPGTSATGTSLSTALLWVLVASRYQIFKMTLDDDTNPTGFSYSISKDDPFFNAVWTYTNEGTEHLILTGVTSTLLNPAEEDVKYSEYTVTAANDFMDDSTDNGVRNSARRCRQPTIT